MSSTALVTEAVTAQRPNRYAGTCISCGKRVEATEGFLVKTVEGKSAVICRIDLLDVAVRYQVAVPTPSALLPEYSPSYTSNEMAALAEREYFDERNSGPTTLADAHSQWHAVNGRYAICDLDCGSAEGLYDEDAEWTPADEETWAPADALDADDRYREEARNADADAKQALLAQSVSDAVAYSYVDRQDLVPFRPRRGVAPEAPVVPAGHVSVESNGQTYVGVAPGTYTLETAQGHRTFRIRVQRTNAKFAPGRTLIEYLSGADNEGDYTGFGFINQGSVLKPWKRFEEGNTALLADAREFLAHPERATAALNCIRCNALLTTPESLARGMGPKCASKGW